MAGANDKEPKGDNSQLMFMLTLLGSLAVVNIVVTVLMQNSAPSNIVDDSYYTANEATLLGLSKPELVQMVVALRSGEKIDVAGATPPPTTKRKQPSATAQAAFSGADDLEDTPATDESEDEDEDDYVLEGLGPEAKPTDEKLKQVRKDERVRTKALAKTRTKKEQKAHETGYNRNKFNQWISDKLSLHRRSWDTRPKGCIDQQYVPRSRMPNVSVMIIFHNEARSTLLRTAWSVLDRSPAHLIHEIVFVDDGSDFDHLLDPLDEDVAKIPKTKLVRLTERVGLIQAKVEGVRRASGEVLVFMDSHCEVNDGWLEPLLDRIIKNPKAVACPVIDAIDADTFQVKEAIVEMGAFTWGLTFYWLSPPHTKHDKELKTVVPFDSPAMAGGIFAMRRDYFIELGEYDDGMETWGGENFEMSFRVWMCGGVIENVPCSHIAHVFRTESPYKFKTKSDPHKTINKNLNRVASVWMDEYADVFYNVSAHSSKNYATGHIEPAPGDVSARSQLRKDKKCKSFRWYMENIATYMYIPFEEHYHQFGRLKNLQSGECMYHEGNPDGSLILAVFRDCEGPVDRPQEGRESVTWYLTKGSGREGQLRHEAEYGSRCLHAHNVKKNSRLSLARCYDQEFPDERLRWTFNEKTQQIYLHNKPTACLTAGVNDQIIITKCKTSASNKQKWTFLPYESEAAHDEL